MSLGDAMHILNDDMARRLVGEPATTGTSWPRLCRCGRPTTDRYAANQSECFRCAHSKRADPMEVDDRE